MTKIAIEFTLENMPKATLLQLRRLLQVLNETGAAEQCLKMYLQGDQVQGISEILKKGPGKI